MRPRFRIVLASLLAIVSGACAASSGGAGGGGGGAAAGPSQPALAQGEDPVENGQTREAERQLGLALIAQGDAARAAYEAAAASAERAIQTDARNPLPWKQAGQAYAGLRQYAKADSAFDQAEELRPIYKLEIDQLREQAWIGIYQEGAELLNASRYQEVVPIYEQANVIFDQRPEIMALLGQVHLQLGNTDPAITNLRQALAIIQSDRINEMDSATAEYWREQEREIPPVLAQAYIRAERLPEAVAVITPMLDRDPANADFARTLASVYAQMGQQDSVRAVYQRMESAAAGNLSAYDYQVIGLGYYEVEDYAAAANSLESALRIAPKDRDAAEWRARALLLQVQEQGASADRATLQQLAEAAQLWVDLDPNSQNAYTMLATALNTLSAGGTQDPRVVQAIQAAEGLKVRMDNMQMRRERPGGATVVGDIENVSGTSGQTVTVTFTFYGTNGSAVGTQAAQVTLGPAGQRQPLDVRFDSAEAIDGYSYQVTGI
jgi:tetratricopeptide (TPR) repeat protein